MRTASFLVTLIITACSSGPPIEALEDEALATGAWGEVEQREALLKERQERHTSRCATGRVWVCIEDPSGEKCGCVRVK